VNIPFHEARLTAWRVYPACVPTRWILVCAAVAAMLAAGATSASASTIVYQCGPAVCAVDPDAGGKPRQLTADGRLAGLTGDGVTASWVDPSGALVQAPVAGGAPVTVPFTGTVSNQPSMSPDGTRYLWWYAGPDGFGGLNAVWVRRLTVGQPETEGMSFCGLCVTSHGWLGSTPIAAFPSQPPRAEPSQVCRLATPAEEPAVSGSCVQVLVSDSRGGIGFPSGNAAGTEIVAAMTPGEVTGIRGRIVRYSIATGGPIVDVTEGTTDTTPVFSAEGDRIAFERDGQIVVKDLGDGAERVVGTGVYPFWGGARSLPLRVAKTLAARALRKGRASVRVDCPAACRVRASLQVGRATARRLGLGRSRTIATASGSRKRAGTATLRLRATGKSRPRLARLRSYRATLGVTVRPSSGGAATRATASVRIRR
jgi:hypothetical protein